MAKARHGTRTEFGDFQTPHELAATVCALLAERIPPPSSIIEPTCGVGSFVLAALKTFPSANSVVGIEINSAYVDELRAKLNSTLRSEKVRIINASFFSVDWLTLRAGLPDPLLIVGNLPWVTNAALGALGSDNLPEKSNFQGHLGLDAITGKSNFDISEYMIRRLLDQFAPGDTTIALLCKTAVARKILSYAWSADLPVYDAEIRRIDTASYFDASVEACLFVVRTGQTDSKTCQIYADLSAREPTSMIGFEAGDVIADVSLFERWKHLAGTSPYQWRSGIKHDCSKVMELRRTDAGLMNGLDELVDIEDTFLYPLLKSSDVANGNQLRDDRFMLVPQRSVAEDTTAIQLAAPKTWRYLEAHGSALDGRASSIYRNRPRFSVFGVGPYTFSPWKVAISGLYKKLHFAPVGPFDHKPRVLDDTAYFLSCESEDEARLLGQLLTSEASIEFLSARVFWDAKRPITVDLLSRLSIPALARELGREEELHRVGPNFRPEQQQSSLFN